MNSDAVVELLARVPLLSGRLRTELAALAPLASVRHVAAGRALVDPDTDEPLSFLIVEGSAEVTLRGAPVQMLHRGDFVDEVSLERLSAWATVTAVSPMVVLVLPPEAVIAPRVSSAESIIGRWARDSAMNRRRSP